VTKHISSDAIGAIATYLSSYALDGPSGVPSIQRRVDQTDVGFPAFGVIGMPFHTAYGHAQEGVRTALDEVTKSIKDYITELDAAKKAWIAAEDANTVVVE
jgi:hypothetical protein